jgi:predicted flap endonuclease-1-like 5' DNA nuclease
MTYLLLQIFICLLIAFVIGLLIGWWIGRRNCAARVSELEAEVSDLNAALTRCEGAKSAVGASASGGGAAAGKAAGAAPLTAAAPIAAAIPIPIPTEPDDLKKVWGIGPKMEEVLNGAGIDTFAELSQTSVERLREIVSAYGSKRLTDIANEEVWPDQAAMAARGDWDELKEYQNKLSWREGGGKPTS